MRNSTIVPKKKQLSCGHFDYNFSKGRCKQCATIDSTKLRHIKENSYDGAKLYRHIEDETGPVKDVRFLPKINSKTKGKIKIEGTISTGSDFKVIDKWFKEREKDLTGVCQHCGGKTQKGQKNYKCSVAHILPKAYFKSVATHPDNFLELCFYGDSCHTNFDNNMIDIMELNCFDDVIKKFTRMYPDIAPEERRRIPALLLEYVKIEL
jgi:hypothetical protein